MPYVVSLQGFTPPPRYDALPWTLARVQEAPAEPGPWTTLSTVTLSPVDPDPGNPLPRNFTVTSASPTGWYRVEWVDAGANIADSTAVFSDQTTYQSSGVPFSALVSRLRAMTAVSADEAKARINQVHKRMVAEGEALRIRRSIGDTVAGQNIYSLDRDIVQLLNLRVDGKRYDLKSQDEIDDLNASEAFVVGRVAGRFFAPEFSAAGVGEVLIYPTPAQSGLSMVARTIMLPPDLFNDSDYPSLPADFHEDLVDAAMATVFLRDDERLQDALALEARFKDRIHELRGRSKRRIGSGPARIKISR